MDTAWSIVIKNSQSEHCSFTYSFLAGGKGIQLHTVYKMNKNVKYFVARQWETGTGFWLPGSFRQVVRGGICRKFSPVNSGTWKLKQEVKRPTAFSEISI